MFVEQPLSRGGTLWINGRLATFNPAVHAPFGLLDDHVLATAAGKVVGCFHRNDPRLSELGDSTIDLNGRWVTPAFIDCHTHLVFAGNRASEWDARLAGTPYSEIARSGGGILHTVQCTRTTSESELVELAAPRLRALISEGVACVEIKSGYGLSTADELKMLRAARSLESAFDVEVATTLLAAHAVPLEFLGRADDYVELIAREMIPRVQRERLAEAVDVFCESIAFSAPQARRVLEAAKNAGFAVKGHVEQLSRGGGAALLAELGACSADHLEYLDEKGVAALAASGAVAVLLPAAFYFLREKQVPPVAALRQAKVPMAVATDLNPGTAPFASLRLAMNFACVLYGLTIEECLAGVTREAARALNRLDRLGTLEAGKDASFLVWDIDHPAQIPLELGVQRLKQRVFRGKSQYVSA